MRQIKEHLGFAATIYGIAQLAKQLSAAHLN
jgi:hypothetical protein